ncbi:SDR family NAD(P)-dependent oxidoreductase, partial [Streptomyces sp. NPDC094038]|uniref:SDR family NAD(P)-dependent oxidoreductase n=1 Tax=Streptomyces sp. NPDC094038 TaxID=3366055 RepID=UPI003807095D
QGSQWVGMGRQLMSWPVFAETMDECEQALAPFVDWALTQVLDDDEALAQVDVVQPVLWAVMVSLAAVWRSAGVLPAAVVGHSQGEIAAACVAGVLSLPDAAKVVALRSQAIKALTGLGGMASVALPVEQVEYHLREWASRVSVAAVNGPASTVIAGDTEALAEVVNVLQARDVQVKHIAVDYASHSPLVERIRDELLQALATVAPSAGTATMISTVTGEPVDGAELDAGYWYRNLRETVVFEGATRWLLKHGHDLFIEVSPHPVLQLALTETIDDTHAPATVLSTLRRDDDTPARLTRSVAAAFTAGAPVDWSAFKTAVGIDGQASRIGLPTYAFQRQRFWPAPMPVPAEVVELNAEFWAAVDSEDISAIASMLGAHGADDESSLAAAVPLLSDWRRRRGDESIVDKWRYTVGWKPLPVNSAASLTGTWLAFRPAGQEDAGSVDSIINGLNVRVVSVELNSADLTVDRLGDRLAELVAREGKEFEGVLLFTPAFDESVREGVERPASLLSVVTALQALDSAGILAPLWCFTRNAVSVGHDDSQIDICQAGVWGLGRTAALELPHRWGGLMDLPADVDSDTASSVVSVLSHAIGEDQVAIRSSGLFGRRLKHADGRDGSWEPADADVSGGTVLVTGGTGGLGAHVARWLARQGAAHLLLTSRRGDQAPGAVALREELSDLGAAVTIVACDVADIDSLAVVLGEIPAEHPLVGAIHTAGIVEEVSIGDLDEEALARVLSGKVVGAENLDRLLDSHPLKFFVSFSSMAGVWGGGGQAAYSAANAMLDAVAHRRRARGLVATSVAWGHWAGEGLAAEGDRAGILSGRGLVAMQPDLAVMALGQALKYGDRFMAVADIDWDRFIPLFTSSRLSPLLSDLSEALEIGDGSEPGEGTGTSSVIRTRLVATPVSEQRAVMRDWVRAQVAILLGYSDPQGVPADRAFKELGFDSLTAVELRNRLQVLTGLKLPTTLLFDFPNSAVLADHLLRLLMGIEADRNDVDADPDDARIRNTLMTIPLSRLREAGLVKMLLNLSVQPDESRATEQAEPSAETGVDELLRRAFDMQIRVDGRNGE